MPICHDAYWIPIQRALHDWLNGIEEDFFVGSGRGEYFVKRLSALAAEIVRLCAFYYRGGRLEDTDLAVLEA